MASAFSSPWPNPNSPVLSMIDFGVPLVELFKWLDVRDTFLGENNKKQDITAALALARDCKHPDAVWLASIFEGKDISTKQEAKKVLHLHQNDARALCFAWYLTEDRRSDLALLRRSSEMGNAFACSTLCGAVWRVDREEGFRMAQFSAAQHERDGFFCLGSCFRDGIFCEKNLSKAKEYHLIAAELGDVFAAADNGNLLDKSDPARWLWFSRAALSDLPGPFLDSFAKQVERFFSGSGNATVVFLIGRALKRNIDMEKTLLFGFRYDDIDSIIGPANQAISFYDSQTESARVAVDTWSLVATRLHMIKDMRILIGKMIWEARFEANYDFDLDDYALSSSSSPLAYLSSASSSSASSPVRKRSRKRIAKRSRK